MACAAEEVCTAQPMGLLDSILMTGIVPILIQLNWKQMHLPYPFAVSCSDDVCIKKITTFSSRCLDKWTIEDSKLIPSNMNGIAFAVCLTCTAREYMYTVSDKLRKFKQSEVDVNSS